MARVYLRGKTWYGDYFLGGKRIREPLDTDERRARKKLDDILRLKASGKLGSAGSVSLSVFLKDFLQRFDGQPARKNRNAYVRAFRELLAVFPVTHLSQITPKLLEQTHRIWKQKGRGLYVRNKDLRCIKAAMRYAEAMDYLPPQRWDVVKEEKEPRGRLEYYTVEELRALLAVAKGAWNTLVRLMARCGLRLGEAVWLTWEDVDFSRRRVHVVSKDGWHPKTYEHRWVPMPDDLVSHLESQTKKVRWVVPNERGQRLAEWTASQYLKRLIQKANLHGVPYSLRHTYGAHMASSGEVTLHELSRLLGHASSRTTEIYAHLMPERRQRASQALPPL